MPVKKNFPKLKKSIKNFLTDESGKITKKDALWISAGSLILAWIEDVVAGHWSSSTPYSQPHANGYQWWTAISGINTTHASGLVNGHYSGTPNGWAYSWRTGMWHLNQASFSWTSHASHNSHWNHGSWGWC